MPRQMICKLQVPLASSLPVEEHLALIYNQDRTFEVMKPITTDISEAMRGRPKIFVEICLTPLPEDGSGFIILREVPNQGW